ncbi:MAG: hypothetical protein ACUZ8H_14630 [Candidatus Anammoxibacter sp.]
MDKTKDNAKITNRKCGEPDINMLLDRFHFLQIMRVSGIDDYEMVKEIAMLKLRVLSIDGKRKSMVSL